jgi:RimJ/RimL family protein N-acetyltransferase
VGYLLAKQYWGQGLLFEAMQILLDFAFTELGLNRIEAEVITANAVSAKVLHKLGFTEEGCLRERWIVSGQKYDIAAFGLLRQEWRVGKELPVVAQPSANFYAV